MKKSINYSEGTIFALKLRKEGFAIGIVTRVSKSENGIIMAWFSDKRFNEIPGLARIESIADFPFKWRIGDLSLIDNTWSVLGQKQNFKSEDWPIPTFIRKDPFSNKAWEVKYRENDIETIQSETPTDFSREDLERDSLMGAGSVELKLDKLVK